MNSAASADMASSADERHLRRLLAWWVNIPRAYYDDGEASGTEHGIAIDFMRESLADLDAKLRALTVARTILAGEHAGPKGQTRNSTTSTDQVDHPARPCGRSERNGMNWIEEARQMAAQCWCDEDTSGIEMDVRLVEAVARRIAAWMDTAARAQRSADFYRGLVDECARHLGPRAFTAEDGTLLLDPVRLRVPELVAELAPMRKDAKRYRWLRDAPRADVRIVGYGARKGDALDAVVDELRGAVQLYN